MSTEVESVDLVGDETAENLARAVVFAALTAATAPVSATHPLFPSVPVTLQTFWVYLAGIVLGPVWGALAFVLYLLAGAIGLPVFEGGGGLAYLLGPTGGFLAGFVVSTVAIGLIVHGGRRLRDPRDVGLARIVAAVAIGTAIVYVFGSAWYALAGEVAFLTTLVGMGVFLPTAVVKLVAAVAVVRSEAIIAR